jgi:hypothetical protein
VSTIAKGWTEVTAASAPSPSNVVLKLVREAFKGHNVGTFALAPEAGGTEVTWSMKGPQPFMAKLMSTVMNLDRMINTNVEARLKNLQQLTEQ